MIKGDPGYVQAVIDQKAYGLTFVQQEFVKKNATKHGLVELMRLAYKEDTLDERAIEYDQIRKYVAKVKRNIASVDFTEEQLSFIENNASTMKALEMAKSIFPKKNIVPLSAETQTISKYLDAVGIKDGEEPSEEDYRPPKAAASLVRKINGAVPNANWNPNDLSPFQKKCVEAMKSYLQSARIINFMRICVNSDMKALFEEEFIKAVFDKYDLNSEELNMFISLCMEYVNIHLQTQQKMDLEIKISSTLDETEEGKRLYTTWVDLLNSREADLHRSKSRAVDLQKNLSSTRSKRLESMAMVNESLSKFVEEWKSQEGRDRALIVAKAKALDLKNEIDRIASAEDYIAQVFGIGEDEILRF